MSNQMSQIERVENVIWNSLTYSQYHENTCFTLNRISVNQTKLSLNVTKYGLVPVTALKKLFQDLSDVFGLENLTIKTIDKNTIHFSI